MKRAVQIEAAVLTVRIAAVDNLRHRIDAIVVDTKRRLFNPPAVLILLDGDREIGKRRFTLICGGDALKRLRHLQCLTSESD